MIPHERSLVKRLQGKPFALIGVNSDRDPEQLKKDLKENQVTWRSFQNQRKENKAIADEWNLRGWPTLYLIDHEGVIRKKWLGSPKNEVLDKEVENLVQAAGERHLKKTFILKGPQLVSALPIPSELRSFHCLHDGRPNASRECARE